MQRVIVGMSGGVDSAATAYLLKLGGYDVVGVTLRTWQSADGAESRCCEIGDAQRIADHIGIPYYVVNCLTEFRECVTEPFTAAYLRGETPNPCVVCNRAIKWEKLLEAADNLHADCVATGHYAAVLRAENGRYTVQQALHSAKDQTYMLYRLTQAQLARTVMPLGKLTKPEVRRLAEEAGLPVAHKPDSQEICFIPDGKYSDYVENNAKTEIPPEGLFVDAGGNPLGRHRGIHCYTIGQRRGLGLALGYPAFVQHIDPQTNQIVIGREEALYTREIFCEHLNFMGIPQPDAGTALRASVKIRYHHPAQAAVLHMLSDDCVRVVFDEPVRAAAPGQSAVFYDAERCVLGGGFITAAKESGT